MIWDSLLFRRVVIAIVSVVSVLSQCNYKQSITIIRRGAAATRRDKRQLILCKHLQKEKLQKYKPTKSHQERHFEVTTHSGTNKKLFFLSLHPLHVALLHITTYILNGLLFLLFRDSCAFGQRKCTLQERGEIILINQLQYYPFHSHCDNYEPNRVKELKKRRF